MAYPAGNVYAWNGLPVHTLMPASGETVNGTPFPVPAGAKVMTIHVPNLAGTDTIKIQSLAPTETVEATQVWSDVKCFDLTDGTLEALDGITESTAVTLPISATGGGVLRFVSSADESGAPVSITVFFSRDG